MSTLIHTMNLEKVHQRSFAVDNSQVKKQNKENEASLFSGGVDSDKTSYEHQEQDGSTNINKWLKITLGLVATAGVLTVAYIKRDSIKALFNKTKLGEVINTSLKKAKEAKTVPLESVATESGGIYADLVGKFASKDAMKKIITDKGLVDDAMRYSGKRVLDNPNLVKEMSESVDTVKKVKAGIELSGTGPTKIAQIVSNDPSVMARLDDEMPILADALRQTKTDCNPGRTFEEAVEFLEESFPGKGYKLEKQLGVGSMGATYLAKSPTGERVAIKMIKNGVTPQSLKEEERLITDAISKVCSGDELEKTKAMLRDLYKGWAEELNLAQSLEYNKAFANGAQRYRVARVLDVAQNGESLVMEMADGIQMNKLMDLLSDYKANPAEFAIKHADMIEKHPWLSNPDKVMSELSGSITKAFSEQFLFLKNGQSVMHGDPHTGNFFITATKEGRLIPKFIDTDNCVIRTSKQIKDDITMFVNYLIGNPKKVAEYYVNQCGCAPADRAKYIQAVSEDLSRAIFNRKQNVTQFSRVQDIINSVLKKHGLSMSAENATALKSQMQFLKVISETGRLSGNGFNFTTLISDIPKAVYSMIKSGENPFTCLKDALVYTIRNPRNSIANAGQFFV